MKYLVFLFTIFVTTLSAQAEQSGFPPNGATDLCLSTFQGTFTKNNVSTVATITIPR